MHTCIYIYGFKEWQIHDMAGLTVRTKSMCEENYTGSLDRTYNSFNRSQWETIKGYLEVLSPGNEENLRNH